MDFYEEWYECLLSGEDDTDYLEAFLKKKKYTTTTFLKGNNEQISNMCKLLINYDIEKVIEVIDKKYITKLDPSKIIQFSNFENGTLNIVKLLYIKKEMEYTAIGRELIQSVEEGAAKKYGENHSKLARDFNLVEITNTRPAKVKNTRFGDCFVFFEKSEQDKLLKILGIRDPLILNIIAKLKEEIVYYVDECQCLSESTAIRRRSNVKKLFEFIFEDSKNQIKSNIMW